MGYKKTDTCLQKAFDDEMLFVLMARDQTAPQVIFEWIKLNIHNQPKEKLREAFECALEMSRSTNQINIRKMSKGVNFEVGARDGGWDERAKKAYDSLVEKNKITTIARACHEANKVWCMSMGDLSQRHWNDAEEWQRQSAIGGVRFRLDNPDAKHDAQHNAWMQDKINDGWIYGEKKDAEKKTHPCLVPFEELPEFQQRKDALFCAIVDALR